MTVLNITLVAMIAVLVAYIFGAIWYLLHGHKTRIEKQLRLEKQFHQTLRHELADPNADIIVWTPKNNPHNTLHYVVKSGGHAYTGTAKPDALDMLKAAQQARDHFHNKNWMQWIPWAPGDR